MPRKQRNPDALSLPMRVDPVSQRSNEAAPRTMRDVCDQPAAGVNQPQARTGRAL